MTDRNLMAAAISATLRTLPIRRLCSIVSCALALTVNPTLPAQNSAVHVSQLAHTAWRLREGTVPGPPNAIAQTRDGYIWVGAENGLYRFDGEAYQQIEATAPDHILRVNSLLADRDGSLWIGAGTSLYHLQLGKLHKMSGLHRVTQMFQTAAGDVVIATRNLSKQSACRVRKEALDCPSDLGLPAGGTSIADDGEGGFWVTDSKQLKHRNADGTAGLGDAQTPWHGPLYALSSDGRGRVWAGVHEVGKLAQLFEWDGKTWTGQPFLPGLRSSTDIQSVFADKEGALWIGTSDLGIYRVTSTGTDRFDQADGLSNNQVSAVTQDAEGSIWLATSGGIDHLHRSLVDSWSTREGLSADGVSAIVADRAGRVWMSNTGGLDVLENGVIRSYRPGEGLPGGIVSGMATDKLGRLWVGIDEGLWILDNGKFQHILGPDGKDVGQVINMQEDAVGQMWIKVSRKLFRSTDGGLQLVEWKFANLITALNADPIDGMWAGARNLPAFHIAGNAIQIKTDRNPSFGDSFRRLFRAEGKLIGQTQQQLAVVGQEDKAVLDRGNGLTYEVLYSSALASNGDLYLMTDKGYLRIAAKDFHSWLSNPKRQVQTKLIDGTDGAIAGASTFGPSSATTLNGDIWFATDRFPQRIVPSLLNQPRQQTPILIQSVIADGVSLQDSRGLSLKPRTQTVDIRYAALSYLNPKRMQYRYLLEGYDTDWQNADLRRQAQYSHLSPGKYRFRVQARDRDENWTSQEATVDFQMLPCFYQTIWFKSLMFVIGGFSLWLIYLARLRYLLGRSRAQLYERMSERERIARDLHDTFFQGIQGLFLRFQTGTSALPAAEPVRPMFEELLKQSDQVMHEGRELVLDLRTPFGEDEDLAQSLASACSELQTLSPIKFSVIVHGKAKPIPARTSEEVFRIAKEAITNAFLHSAAKLIEVELTFEDTKFTIRIRDDGRGIDPGIQQSGGRAGHFGLTGMRERAHRIGATLDIWSQASAGTEIELNLQPAFTHGTASRYWGWLSQLKDNTFRGLSS